jgi:hypothetical protein
MQEAEIKRITVPGQPGQKSLQDPKSMAKTGRGGTHITEVVGSIK